MTYREALRYLESFINYEKIASWPYKRSLKLKRFQDFLSTVNNPQEGLNCLHVSGTKGKGSTCAFIAYILRKAGYKVGLYTSPHLCDFRERIRILSPRTGSSIQKDFEGMIPRKELADLVTRLKPAIDKYNKGSKYGNLSFFEVYTGLAFVYFREKNTDFVVLETGLGGRLDATNTASPLVCVITPISYEHTHKLGNTLGEIAWERAGIIKSSRAMVVSAPQRREVRNVIAKKCRALKAKLCEVNKQIKIKKINGRFNIKGIFAEYLDLRINLLGRHQLMNAAAAVGAVESLRFYGINIDPVSIKNGLYETVWPGRLEIVSKKPWIVLDGAQNVASARALKQAIDENFSGKYKKLFLVFGISKDKDIKGTSRELADLADAVILTKAGNPRAKHPHFLREYFSGKKIYTTKSVKGAIDLAMRIAKSQDLALVAGSLFVVGEARARIKQ